MVRIVEYQEARAAVIRDWQDGGSAADLQTVLKLEHAPLSAWPVYASILEMDLEPDLLDSLSWYVIAPAAERLGRRHVDLLVASARKSVVIGDWLVRWAELSLSVYSFAIARLVASGASIALRTEAETQRRVAALAMGQYENRSLSSLKINSEISISVWQPDRATQFLADAYRNGRDRNYIQRLRAWGEGSKLRTEYSAESAQLIMNAFSARLLDYDPRDANRWPPSVERGVSQILAATSRDAMSAVCSKETCSQLAQFLVSLGSVIPLAIALCVDPEARYTATLDGLSP